MSLYFIFESIIVGIWSLGCLGKTNFYYGEVQKEFVSFYTIKYFFFVCGFYSNTLHVMSLSKSRRCVEFS